MLRILIVYHGPVPTPHNLVVEGGGLRAWHLFEGLSAHFPNEVFLASPALTRREEGSHLLKYSSLPNLIEIAKTFDYVLCSYSHPFAPDFFRQLPSNVVKVADAYVPIHVEVSARLSKDVELEQLSFDNDRARWTAALESCHAILIANSNQELYYLGLLSALGLIGPANYEQIPIISFPLGVDNATAGTSDAVKDYSRTVVWWGGFYPWFDFERLTEIATALEERAPEVTLQIVGAKNPFVAHPDFQYLPDLVLKSLELAKNVQIVPWIPHNRIGEFFADKGAVLVLNKEGTETRLSWRTRFRDVVGLGIPLVTNGGDPFGDMLIEQGAAIYAPEGADAIVNEILRALDPCVNLSMREALSSMRLHLSAKSNAANLVEYINLGTDAFRLLETHSSPGIGRQSSESLIKRLPAARKVAQFVMFSRRHGVLSALRRATQIVMERLQANLSNFLPKEPLGGNLILTHQLDLSGAPMVALDLAQNWRARDGQTPLIVSPSPPTQEILTELVTRELEHTVRFAGSPLKKFQPSNVVINSSAIPRNWFVQSLEALETGRIRSLKIFVHENEPEMFISRDLATLLKRASSNPSLGLFSPSQQASEKLRFMYGLGLESKISKLRVRKAPQMSLELKVSNLRIALVGPSLDDRKKQSEVIQAVAIAQSKIRGESNVRPIHLSLIGLSNGGSLQALTSSAQSLLNKNSFEFFGSIGHDQVLEKLSSHNVVVSLSGNESLAIYIVEAMSSGSVVLRTETGGAIETVIPGTNGHILSTGDAGELAEHLVRLSRRSETSDSTLVEMMKSSMELAEPFLSADYGDFFGH